MRAFLTLWLAMFLVVYGVGQAKCAYTEEQGLGTWLRMVLSATALALAVALLA